MRKSRNSGFSLVELIIVVAIMAVLIGILTPAYLRYVEKSKAIRDENYADSVRKVCETLVSDPDEKLETGSYTITIAPDDNVTIFTPDGTASRTHVDTYLKDVLGADYANYRIQCKSYKQIEIKFSNTTSPSCSIQYTKK